MVESVPVDSLSAVACRIPTDRHEADGTFAWNHTTMVLVTVTAGGRQGTGYTYAPDVTARLINTVLVDVVIGQDVLNVQAIWARMVDAVRNAGRPGLASEAIAAVDIALWDLKAKLFSVPLCRLLGIAKDHVPIYGSGGFTSYTTRELQDQLAGWAAQGVRMVKMKVGSRPELDVERVAAARAAIGPDVELFVDANGAYSRKGALTKAERFAEYGVTWFEEPVSSDDLEGLALLRNRLPPPMNLAAGEYGYDLNYFLRMLEARAVDVLQADATRCMGFTEFLRVGALCSAYNLPLSAHTAPNLHVHPSCALPAVVHIEYFHDHVRIEDMFFDGALRPSGGKLQPDTTRPGIGLTPRPDVIERFLI